MTFLNIYTSQNKTNSLFTHQATNTEAWENISDLDTRSLMSFMTL